MGKIITSTEVKTLLQISGSEFDTFINTMIPVVEDFILNYCSISEERAQTKPGLKMAAASMINFHLQTPSNIQSETIGNYSVSYNQSYPNYILNSLKPYRTVKFFDMSKSFYGWTDEKLENFV